MQGQPGTAGNPHSGGFRDAPLWPEACTLSEDVQALHELVCWQCVSHKENKAMGNSDALMHNATGVSCKGRKHELTSLAGPPESQLQESKAHGGPIEEVEYDPCSLS